MYAVIRAGGKQHKVAPGDVIEIEKVTGKTVSWTPLLVVDDKGKSHAGKKTLAKAKVTAKVLGDGRGPKLSVVKFRNKSGYRRKTGHRQTYSSVQIADIKIEQQTAAKQASGATAPKQTAEAAKTEAQEGARGNQ